MARVNKPMEGEATYWENMIEDADYNTLFQSSVSNDTDGEETEIYGTNPMPKNYLNIVYGYTVCCGDRKKLITCGYLTRNCKLSPNIMCSRR